MWCGLIRIRRNGLGAFPCFPSSHTQPVLLRAAWLLWSGVEGAAGVSNFKLLSGLAQTPPLYADTCSVGLKHFFTSLLFGNDSYPFLRAYKLSSGLAQTSQTVLSWNQLHVLLLLCFRSLIILFSICFLETDFTTELQRNYTSLSGGSGLQSVILNFTSLFSLKTNQNVFQESGCDAFKCPL